MLEGVNEKIGSIFTNLNEAYEKNDKLKAAAVISEAEELIQQSKKIKKADVKLIRKKKIEAEAIV